MDVADYEASGVPAAGKGARFDEMLATMRVAWEGDDVGPDTPGGGPPEVLIGGGVDAAFRRVARYGAGWTATGENAPETADRDLEHYYAWLGEDIADALV